MRIQNMNASEAQTSLQSYVANFSKVQNLDPDTEELGVHYLEG